MRYRILHTTHYTYSQSVFLKYHVLRLRPRSDGSQLLRRFEVKIDPLPHMQTEDLDPSGNACLGVWFENQATSYLTIKTVMEVETCRTNPFDYLANAWAVNLPVDYPTLVAATLAPYRHCPLGMAISPGVIDLAQTMLHEVNYNLSYFLTTLTQRIYDECTYAVRPEGDPMPAGTTWRTKQGSCRDFTVLFMEACRAVGLAARFVSGYQEGDPDQPAHDLHAWAEVYIPGGGWRGFDPTHGVAVSDRHIAIAVGAHPRQAAPVSGTLREGVTARSALTTQITVEGLGV
ncbi:transglutaminase domain-containing protein [Leptolyngbya sp. PCC 6406]|uniref:transglutaminase family protein n=1 Tax=Leptolyngbya sp. PCC 6406 TaxID=1173264 RepID=UPI0002AC06A7|nr:transglutaminase family protein [Leptolyngbya sp. PCC 6406]